MKRSLMLRALALRARGTIPPPVTAAPEPERSPEYPLPIPAEPSGRPRLAYQAAAPTSRLITIG
jgi:hypothetical protein